jgi:hypothetical protein
LMLILEELLMNHTVQRGILIALIIFLGPRKTTEKRN